MKPKKPSAARVYNMQPFADRPNGIPADNEGNLIGVEPKKPRVIFLRRAKLGLGSVAAVSQIINGDDHLTKIGKGYVGDKAGYVLNTNLELMPEMRENDYLFRWGCTSRTQGIQLGKQINPSKAIGRVSDKRGFRMLCREFSPEIIPTSYFTYDELPNDGHWVVRRSPHSQGRGLWVCKGKFEVAACLAENKLADGTWYASDYIPKVEEYRVFIAEGRVMEVVRKVVEDKSVVSWNVHEGGKYQVIRWDGWQSPPVMNAIKVAIKACKLAKLDFGGYDVMGAEDGTAYLLEVNSAPSLKPNIEGGLGYSQICAAKCVQHIINNGKGNVPPVEKFEGWRDVIHPAIQGEKE